MSRLLRINDIIPESIVDGQGLRFVIFTQGCEHNCEHCHNPQTHDKTQGKIIDISALYHQIIDNPLLTGVTFSGGEPFLQARPLAALAELLQSKSLEITTYTGFTYEYLLRHGTGEQLRLLRITNTLIDGPFIYEKRNPSLSFRGSENQRILSLKNGLIVD